jgi:hypothetical protein
LKSSILIAEDSKVNRVVLLPIDQLRPHEKGSPLYLELLRREIVRDGMLRYPIVADEKTCVILDGMHRWLALKSIGYRSIPVILVDVFQKPVIRVGRKRVHQYVSDPVEEITIQKVISAGLNGHLMEPRTTRHFFPFSKFQLINYPLTLLKKGAPCDVSSYMSGESADECSLAIKEWLEEISEELGFLTNRKAEVEKEREEFLNRVKSLGSFSTFLVS